MSAVDVDDASKSQSSHSVSSSASPDSCTNSPPGTYHDRKMRAFSSDKTKRSIDRREQVDSEEGSGAKKRQPKCAKCRNHNQTIPVRDHKKECPWKDCRCSLCDLVAERRCVMAKQVRVRRCQAANKSDVDIHRIAAGRGKVEVSLSGDPDYCLRIQKEIPTPLLYQILSDPQFAIQVEDRFKKAVAETIDDLVQKCKGSQNSEPENSLSPRTPDRPVILSKPIPVNGTKPFKSGSSLNGKNHCSHPSPFAETYRDPVLEPHIHNLPIPYPPPLWLSSWAMGQQYRLPAPNEVSPSVSYRELMPRTVTRVSSSASVQSHRIESSVTREPTFLFRPF